MLFVAVDWPEVFLCCCSISITTSCYPLPSICFRDPVSDWFESLAECLHWNVRKKQNNFAVEEEEFWVSTSNDSWEWKVAVSLLYAWFVLFYKFLLTGVVAISDTYIVVYFISVWYADGWKSFCYFLSSRNIVEKVRLWLL